MDTNTIDQGAPVDNSQDAGAPGRGTPIRQEEQGQQSRQDDAYPMVDFGSCWYHEDALKTGAK